jgi:hypothetical protein
LALVKVGGFSLTEVRGMTFRTARYWWHEVTLYAEREHREIEKARNKGKGKRG